MIGEAVSGDTQNQFQLKSGGSETITLWLPPGGMISVSTQNGVPMIVEVLNLHIVHQGDVIQCRLENGQVVELNFTPVNRPPSIWTLKLQIPAGLEYVVDDCGRSARILAMYHSAESAFAVLSQLAELAKSHCTSQFEALS